MMRPSNTNLQVMVANFMADPVVGAAERSMPSALRTELLGHSSEYLAGYIEGIARALTTLQKVDGSLREGSAERAVAQRTMLSVAVVVSAQELLRREEEKKNAETPG